MMLGVSGMINNSGDAGASAESHESGGANGGSGGGGGGQVGGFETGSGGFSEEGERSISGGNRWPRQETLVLLKIRSEMDVAFRDSSFKGPLWEEISRKMADLGYHRNAKKCKEKFENVYKYHKRTKEGRSSKSDGKTYRFFDQLVALENHPPLPLLPPPRPQAPLIATTTMNMAMAEGYNPPVMSPQCTVPSTINPICVSPNTVITNANPINFSLPPAPTTTKTTSNTANVLKSTSFASLHPILSTYSTSSSTSSDEQPERRGKRKRKWEDFFERLMKEVMVKQEELQKKFLEMLEKRERDRIMREEAWRVQETTRLNREHDLLLQERSLAAAKDAAVIAFLQKVTEQQNPNAVPRLQLRQVPENTPPPQPPPAQQPSFEKTPLPPPRPPPLQQTQPPPLPAAKNVDTPKTDNGGEIFIPASSSRWPKAEIDALIKIRTNLDLKYQENVPKGPLWEEISCAMRNLGYNRNAKRCKEKWENINKYFKKVKESSKKRPEDAKTCPYFYQLDALYKEKKKSTDGSFNPGLATKQENPMAPIMVQPEQQWPIPTQQLLPDSTMDDHDRANYDQNDIEDEDEDDEENEEDGGEYEIVTNRPSSVATTIK